MKSEGYNRMGEEITFYTTIEGKGLIKPRVDLAFEKDGIITLMEIKNGPSAGVRYNSPQKLFLDNINIDGSILNTRQLIPVGRGASNAGFQINITIEPYRFRYLHINK